MGYPSVYKGIIMNGLKAASGATKNIPAHHKLAVYYNVDAEIVYTGTMSEIDYTRMISQHEVDNQLVFATCYPKTMQEIASRIYTFLERNGKLQKAQKKTEGKNWARRMERRWDA